MAWEAFHCLNSPDKTLLLTMNHKPSASFQLPGIVWDNQLQARLSVDSEKIINHEVLECILSRGLGTVAAITALVGMI